MNDYEFYISTDKSKLDLKVIKELLKQTYWAVE